MKYLRIRITVLIMFVMLVPLTAAGRGGREVEETPPEEPPNNEPFESAPVPVPEKPKTRAKGRLSGKVTDEDGKPLQGVEVLCIDSEGRTVARGLTDENGTYLFKDLQEGAYTIQVSYSGYGSKKIEFESTLQPPPAPTGLTLYEITGDASGKAILRAQWYHVKGATHYRCELHSGEGDQLLREYLDMMQNFCEFGDLEPGTDYVVRVYAKNDSGYSAEPAQGKKRTKHRRPFAPFNVGVTFAKNNVVELVWERTETEELHGFLIQVRKERGKYLYYSDSGFTVESSKATIINDKPGDFMRFRIDDRMDNDVPFLDNTIPYSFRVIAKDMKGNMSEASQSVTGIVLEDTIPPESPTNIQYEFVGEDLVRLTWDTKDIDVIKYRIYFGTHEDRWDGVSDTGRRYFDIRINRESFLNGEMYVRIIAIDRVGNESGYQPLQRGTTLAAGDEKTEDIILSSDLGYRDRSIALREVSTKIRVKKPTEKTPVKTPRYSYMTLRKKGFIIDRGEIATLTGEIALPRSATIEVKSGGQLIITDATLYPESDSCGGLLFHNGSKGRIEESTIRGAEVGIRITGNKGAPYVKGVTVQECREYGLHIEESQVELDGINVKMNGIGLYMEDSSVIVRNGVFENNERGILADNHKLMVEDSTFTNNRVYGVRLYGGGIVRRSDFQGNYVGMVLERGIGTATVVDNTVEYSRIDGIVVSSSGVKINRNIIARNENHGIYIKNNANPTISENDIIANGRYAVFGGGRIDHCFIARNNGSIYIDDTEERGVPDNVFNSSSTGVIKQIYKVDYIDALSYTSVIQQDS
jgi:parallel beta-helix repeat protein